MSHRFRTCSVPEPTASFLYAKVKSLGWRLKHMDMKRVSSTWQAVCRSLRAIEDFGLKEHARADEEFVTWQLGSEKARSRVGFG